MILERDTKRQTKRQRDTGRERERKQKTKKPQEDLQLPLRYREREPRWLEFTRTERESSAAQEPPRSVGGPPPGPGWVAQSQVALLHWRTQHYQLPGREHLGGTEEQSPEATSVKNGLCSH